MTEADAPAPSGHEQASPATPGPLHESEPPSSAPAPSTVEEYRMCAGLSLLPRATTRLENAGLRVAVKKRMLRSRTPARCWTWLLVTAPRSRRAAR